MRKRHLLLVFTVFLVLIAATTIIIFIARGYRIDLTKKELTGSGVIAVSSTPNGALIYLDDKPISATNSSITSLKPDTYKIRLEKQGFSSYEKEVVVEKEYVTSIDALLIRSAPELKPLTFTGAFQPTLSPDGQKIIFSTSQKQATGIWLLELTDRPFNLTARSNLLIKDTKEEEFSQEEIIWSPDSKKILVSLPGADSGYLFDLTANTLSKEINVEALKSSWQSEEKEATEKLLEGFSKEIREKIASLPNPIWSPDNTKVFYEKDRDIFVYDIKPKDLRKNEPEEYKTYQKPKDKESSIVWYPDSQHLLILEKESRESESGTIKIIEIDGGNEMQIFSGTIISDYLFPYTNGSKVVILTTFNPESKQYNLYSINLR
ncbi:MAG: PEGA domain-containing protein [Candidatus Cloacimonetes bacterium]|nr:PEGA domain-containing protein [Candidatus Cloacimonadota bacterium]